MKKKPKVWCLYRHTTPSGKVYIGITNQIPEYRWNGGKGYMNVKKGPFKNSIIKYGWDNIAHEIIFNELTKEQAIELEKLYIRKYKKLGISLNITDGGEGCCNRVPWNKGKRIPNMNNRRGIPLTEEHKAKLRKPHIMKNTKKRSMPKEQREKMRKMHLGKRQPLSVRLKISKNSKMSKKVLIEHGGIQQTFSTISSAAKILHIGHTTIKKCCESGNIYKGYKMQFI